MKVIRKEALEYAKTLLVELIDDGPRPVREIKAIFAAHGVSERTGARAAYELRVTLSYHQEGGTRVYYWGFSS